MIDKEAIKDIKLEIADDFKQRRKYSNLNIEQLWRMAGKKNGATIYAIEKGEGYTIDSLLTFLCLIDEDRGYTPAIIYKAVSKYTIKRRCRLVQKIISNKLKLNHKLVNSHFRFLEYLQARYYGFKIMNDYMKVSLTDIARMYNRKSHSSVINGLNELSRWFETHNKLGDKYKEVEEEVCKALGYELKKD
jgi:hypothetical protein